METEYWKDILGYENLYQVSNLGRVKSVERKTKNGHGIRTVGERILVPHCNGIGYLQVCLCKDRKIKHFYIHRLVASVFLPNPNGLQEVNHKDECKTNNTVDNLEWCDHTYNHNYGTINERRLQSYKKNKGL